MTQVYTALLDANVLYSATLRDILLQLSFFNVFNARWTEEIHQEWISAVIRVRPENDITSLERTKRLMDSTIQDALIVDYESLIPILQLPDPDDRHVLAAAIVGKCDFIITKNLKDFPSPVLSEYQVEALHPDIFLSERLGESPDVFCKAIRALRARLKKPAFSVPQYLERLYNQDLPLTVMALTQYQEIL